MLCLVGCGIGLVVGEDDRLTDVQRDERQPDGAFDFIVDGGRQSNGGGTRDLLEPFTDGLLEGGGAGAVGRPERDHAGHDADNEQRDEEFSLESAGSS